VSAAFPYGYTPVTTDSYINGRSGATGLARFRVQFPSALDTPILKKTTVLGDYVFPGKDGEKAPLVIILHGMGNSSMFPCRMIANSLARRGIASLTLYEVIHKDRIPASIKTKFPRLSEEEWFESYQVSVTDARQALDWSGTRPELLQDKIAILGISFGGFIASIAMGLDERLKAGVFIESAGNSDKITRDSFLLRFQYKSTRSEYEESQRTYADYLKKVAARGFTDVPPAKNSYWTDPKTFSFSVKSRPVLMLNALMDEIIPRSAVMDLWQAYDRPSLYWFPATHATIWAWYPLLARRITAFLETSLS
jgi:cephalosporin-C deacetylase-like acetyl esterase